MRRLWILAIALLPIALVTALLVTRFPPTRYTSARLKGHFAFFLPVTTGQPPLELNLLNGSLREIEKLPDAVSAGSFSDGTLVTLASQTQEAQPDQYLARLYDPWDLTPLDEISFQFPVEPQTLGYRSIVGSDDVNHYGLTLQTGKLVVSQPAETMDNSTVAMDNSIVAVERSNRFLGTTFEEVVNEDADPEGPLHFIQFTDLSEFDGESFRKIASWETGNGVSHDGNPILEVSCDGTRIQERDVNGSVIASYALPSDISQALHLYETYDYKTLDGAYRQASLDKPKILLRGILQFHNTRLMTFTPPWPSSQPPIYLSVQAAQRIEHVSPATHNHIDMQASEQTLFIERQSQRPELLVMDADSNQLVSVGNAQFPTLAAEEFRKNQIAIASDRYGISAEVFDCKQRVSVANYQPFRWLLPSCLVATLSFLAWAVCWQVTAARWPSYTWLCCVGLAGIALAGPMSRLLFAASSRQTEIAVASFDGVLLGSLYGLIVWSVFGTTRALWRWTALGSGLLAATWTSSFVHATIREDWLQCASSLAILAVCSGGCLFAALLLKRLRLRLSSSVSQPTVIPSRCDTDDDPEDDTQFSILGLFAAMAFAALIVVTAQSLAGPFRHLQRIEISFAPVAAAVAIVVSLCLFSKRQPIAVGAVMLCLSAALAIVALRLAAFTTGDSHAFEHRLLFETSVISLALAALLAIPFRIHGYRWTLRQTSHQMLVPRG